MTRICITPGIRSGKPCVRGTRMTVADVIEYLVGWMTPEELMHEFPDLEAQDIAACQAYGASGH